MPADPKSNDLDAAAAAYWRSVAALREASGREAAATQEVARDGHAVDDAAQQQRAAEPAAVKSSASSARHLRRRL